MTEKKITIEIEAFLDDVDLFAVLCRVKKHPPDIEQIRARLFVSDPLGQAEGRERFSRYFRDPFAGCPVVDALRCDERERIRTVDADDVEIIELTE